MSFSIRQLTTGRFREGTRALGTLFDYVDALPGSLAESDRFELVGTDNVEVGDYFALPVGTETTPLPEDDVTLEELESSKIVLLRLRIAEDDKFFVDIICGEALLAELVPAGTMALAFDAPEQVISVKDTMIEHLMRAGHIDADGDRMGGAPSAKTSARAAGGKSGAGKKRA
eukprot:CAMPEP_0173337244 /NCGR_PEP_ID=MMETSP1144-20121109/7043_1 /TAXON_ID=483371 /ORGANISM="non described non described, Strain CCMP2298" /LENGTH=171 /DNA_ID=CAMNT_0014282703 /DNA_START=685 /DNA_END=1196 /DNA_ORIENTATION=+